MRSACVTVTEVEVCALSPFGSVDRALYTLTLAYRGRGLWAVSRPGRRVWVLPGQWEYEAEVGENSKLCRFSYDTALAIASEQCWLLRVMGLTAEEALELEDHIRHVASDSSGQ